MKFLFIVQGEGRGHLTQAITLENVLLRSGHEVVEILVGKSESRRLPGFFTRSVHAPVKQFVSPNFLPTPANKRVNITRSVLYNIAKVPEYLRSMHYINERIIKTGADMVINFYELLTGLTYFLYRPAVPQVCIGHQYLFLHKDFEMPEKHKFGMKLLNMFTRLTALGAKEYLALSFRSMKDDKSKRIKVVPPLLRRDVFRQEVTNGDYIHGYMVNSGFSECIMRWHKEHPETPLRFFWDRWEETPVKKIDETLSFYQLDDVEFLRQMSGCKAYASTAGFESVCEAMYLGKPLMMVPAHIEQECNAYDAMKSSAGIVDDDFDLAKLLKFAETYKPDTRFREWVNSAEYMIVNELEGLASTAFMHNMYMVEEYI
ncbi:glycosyltransferase family protein [uncultured Bacteroides sp.]|uniref:glycosyltransferase family protein n=1 Tax=uncultured Bacteroides sp. TaxID=162156 RepID=UPI0025CF896F|nr:glycosyltransferase family protein [uncultured Bacteroides sp.]